MDLFLFKAIEHRKYWLSSDSVHENKSARLLSGRESRSTGAVLIDTGLGTAVILEFSGTLIHPILNGSHLSLLLKVHPCFLGG